MSHQKLNTLKLAVSQLDVPQGKHYAICVYEEMRTPDPYDRSDDFVTISHHYVTENYEAWVKKIRELETADTKVDYVAFEVNSLAKVKKVVTVEIEPNA